jgi:preprotein translocase subunit SecE
LVRQGVSGHGIDKTLRVEPKAAGQRHMASKTTNPFTFLQQVRAEAGKVTWPTRRETMISTVMVLVFAVIAMLFFFAADQIMAFGVEFILGIGR